MTPAEQKLVALLRKKAARLRERLEERGGRGVSLAEHVDRLDAAADALAGELYCQHCGARLTGK
jgi:hypothetical protein